MTEAGPPELGEWRRTSALGFVVSGIMALRHSAIPIVAIMFGARGWEGDAVWVGPLVLAILAANFLFSWVAWRHFRYRLGDHDISVEKGLLSRAARSVPYERIQDVSLEQALVPRLFGMVQVKFETGAGGKDELTIAYVSEEQGEALRETVRARKEGAATPLAESAEPGAAPQMKAEQGRLLFEMDLPRLLTFGLFEFSLVVFAVLAGLAQQVDFLLPFDVWDPDTWGSFLAGSEHWLAQFGIAARALAVIFAIGSLVMVGLATGIVRTGLRDWGFRLEETPKGLRRRRGLFTRTDVVMPLHRVQALKIGTGLLRRRFGWHDLSVISLAQDAKSSSHVVVPFGRMEEIAPVVETTGFTLPAQQIEWRRPSAKHRFDRALMAVLPLMLAGVVLAGSGHYWPALAAGLGGIALAFRQHFLWLHDRHAIDGGQLYIRRGWLAPRLDIGSRVKLQSVEIAQGPLAIRRGYADLIFGLAGGSLAMRGIGVEDARAIRGAVLGSIASVDFSRLPG
ncbi:putative membrane protein [Altererythrobacter atlanticus]|uniref:Bacterial membrane flanked domain protein n=1 Tax=Croceibacterium atlanticum TaxID=1267766 RepID=A0A0F7KXB4_9SPHN|nr:PH domain-containing protein [Croceibacterium atlanticum]AKH43415.1 Bacterial membrane flanked domain protein [Croceibacterium atlanticum]MBB5731878.1 putative membrane protein [Croceibacterium atlanticum]